MFSTKDLRDLAQFRSKNPVLTLYLNTDPTAHTTTSTNWLCADC